MRKQARWFAVLGIVAAASLAVAIAVTVSTPHIPETPAAIRPPVQVAFVDSVTPEDGSESRETYATHLCMLMNWSCEIKVTPGAGYVAEDDVEGRSFADVLDSVTEMNPDVVVLAGGRADLSAPIDEVAAAATDLVGELQTALPATRIVVVTGFAWNIAEDAALVADRIATSDALRGISPDLTIVDAADLVDITDDNADELLLDDARTPSERGEYYLSRAIMNSVVAGGLPIGPEIWVPSGDGLWEDKVLTNLGLDL